jgi:hypothetical protein
MPKSGITGSYGSSIFSFLRNCQTAFHTGCSNFHFQEQCKSVLVSKHLHQHLLLLLFLNMAIRTVVRWNLSVVLICICCITREVEHFFMYLLAICTSSFENAYLIHVAISPLVCWFFGCWAFWVPDYIWDISPKWVADKDFLPLGELCLESGDSFFCCSEALSFDAVPFVHSFS